jgi:hypothetical protein
VLTVGRRDQLPVVRLRLLDALCIPLRCIEEIEGKLAELHRAVEQLSDTAEARLASPSPESGRENTVPARSRVVQLADKATLRFAVTKSFEEMNIRGEPIGAESVQAMMAASGVRPEDNAFSRGIVEIREE